MKEAKAQAMTDLLRNRLHQQEAELTHLRNSCDVWKQKSDVNDAECERLQASLARVRKGEKQALEEVEQLKAQLQQALSQIKSLRTVLQFSQQELEEERKFSAELQDHALSGGKAILEAYESDDLQPVDKVENLSREEEDIVEGFFNFSLSNGSVTDCEEGPDWLLGELDQQTDSEYCIGCGNNSFSEENNCLSCNDNAWWDEDPEKEERDARLLCDIMARFGMEEHSSEEDFKDCIDCFSPTDSIASLPHEETFPETFTEAVEAVENDLETERNLMSVLERINVLQMRQAEDGLKDTETWSWEEEESISLPPTISQRLSVLKHRGSVEERH